MHVRLVLEHVETGGKQAAGVQRIGEGGFVDHGASRRVHEHRGRPHECDAAGIDQVAGGVAAGNVERHDVGFREQRIEVGHITVLTRIGARVVQHLHAEP